MFRLLAWNRGGSAKPGSVQEEAKALGHSLVGLEAPRTTQLSALAPAALSVCFQRSGHLVGLPWMGKEPNLHHPLPRNHLYSLSLTFRLRFFILKSQDWCFKERIQKRTQPQNSCLHVNLCVQSFKISKNQDLLEKEFLKEKNSYNQSPFPYGDKDEIHFGKFTLTKLKQQFSSGLQIFVKHWGKITLVSGAFISIIVYLTCN